jgi:cob(I)alamin adenosyltransferase
MVRLYTRTGDDGTTGTYGPARCSKNSHRIDCIGECDQLNAWLGYARSECIAQRNLMASETNEELSRITGAVEKLQHILFKIGGILAIVNYGENRNPSLEISEELIQECEILIDELQSRVPPLKHFVLPGGTRVSGILHLARTSCRTFERRLWAFNDQVEILPKEVLVFINRLSDLLFVMARFANKVADHQEFKWIPELEIKFLDTKKPTSS